jgi:hypothetical protein
LTFQRFENTIKKNLTPGEADPLEMFDREKPDRQEKTNPSSAGYPRLDKVIARILILVQKVTEVLAFAIFILCLVSAGSLFFYSIYFFVVEVIMAGIFSNRWDHVVSNGLHFIEIALIAMLVSLLAPIIFRFYRYCALGETEKLREIRLGLVERWIGSILITIIASFLLEKLTGQMDVSIYTYIGGVLTMIALGLFIYVMKDDQSGP